MQITIVTLFSTMKKIFRISAAKNHADMKTGIFHVQKLVFARQVVNCVEKGCLRRKENISQGIRVNLFQAVLSVSDYS